MYRAHYLPCRPCSRLFYFLHQAWEVDVKDGAWAVEGNLGMAKLLQGIQSKLDGEGNMSNTGFVEWCLDHSSHCWMNWERNALGTELGLGEEG